MRLHHYSEWFQFHSPVTKVIYDSSMIEFILLAASVSVELEPYAVESADTTTSDVGTNNTVDGKAFQWTTRRDKSGNSLPDSGDLDNFGNEVERDALDRPVEAEE